MTENTENTTFEESAINSVTFQSPDPMLGKRTYIEVEPGYWRTLDGSSSVFSSHMEFGSAVHDYFSGRFEGEDLPDYPGSGNGDGIGGGGDGTGGGGDGGWGGGTGGGDAGQG